MIARVCYSYLDVSFERLIAMEERFAKANDGINADATYVKGMIKPLNLWVEDGLEPFRRNVRPNISVETIEEVFDSPENLFDSGI